MGTARSAFTGKPLLVAVNGQVPAVAMPGPVAALPGVQRWMSFWGFTQVK